MAETAKGKGLTDRQERFCREYLVDHNATQAAIRAGYSRRSADVAGARMLGNDKVQNAINRLKLAQQQRLEITADRVLQEIAKLAFANLGDFVDVQEDGSIAVNFKKASKDQLAALQEIVVDGVRIKLADKSRNLELLGKHLKLFSENYQTPEKETVAILKAVKDGDMAPRDAAYEFAMRGLPLPKAVEIELSRQAEELDDDWSQTDVIEKIERRAAEALNAVEHDRSKFLPERRAEVAALKEELKHTDSFALATPANTKGGEEYGRN
ncbi:hypothetical protein PLCT2_01241 [Planctomycetaceae bacterium]|nr:hypothetical protein PLCT2_01241 [Planctomycetaceae bacterium]